MDDLSVTPARHGQTARERFARVGVVTRIAFTIRPSHIIAITVVRGITVAITIAPLVGVLRDAVRG